MGGDCTLCCTGLANERIFLAPSVLLMTVLCLASRMQSPTYIIWKVSETDSTVIKKTTHQDIGAKNSNKCLVSEDRPA